MAASPTGGIDIELIENENPEFLYHTYTGNRISNIYYEYEVKLKDKDSYNEKCNDEIKGNNNNKIVCKENDENKWGDYLNKKNEKEELNCSYECNKNCDINSSISSLSINISEKHKYKKYYYIGESFNNIRNGWGMLIYNDRVIFEGEYKMDNAIGYFIKYNEYSTEIGFRSPISIKSVIIMSDHDNFIIQNKCENLNNNNNNIDDNTYNNSYCIDDFGNSINNLTEYKIRNNNLENILICNNENSICNNTFASFEEMSNSEKLKYKNNAYSYYKIDKNCNSSFEKHHNSIKKSCTEFYKNNTFSNLKQNNLNNNSYIGIKKAIEPSSACNIITGNKVNNLNVISSYIRKNSKHKTTPARSLNYLKPPNMNFIKNNIFSNKNITKNEQILRKKKKKKTNSTYLYPYKYYCNLI